MPYAVRFGRAGANSALTRQTNLPTAVCSIMGWVKWMSSATFAAVFNLAGGSGQRLYFGTNNGGLTELFNGSGSSTGSAITNGRWYHWAMTNDGSTITGYVNGVSDVTLASVALTPGELDIGTDQDAEFANAAVGALKIWNRCLTVDQIAAEIPWCVPIDWAGLNACYPMPTGQDAMTYDLTRFRRSALSTSRWLDISGNTGNDFSETGTVDLEIGPPVQFAPSRFLASSRHIVPSGPPPTGGLVPWPFFNRRAA